MVKIIAFDLDGTLYDKHKHIDEDTIHKIIEFEQIRKKAIKEGKQYSLISRLIITKLRPNI